MIKEKCMQGMTTEDRMDAILGMHEAVAYNQWLAAEIQASIDDPRPSIPHEEVMARMDAKIAKLKPASSIHDSND